ncbi:MAG TPA: ornithine aminomutase [Sediminispirochaeta sp.]|nr:ornithine aminomutase [Sediminispirochaeta sp.]
MERADDFHERRKHLASMSEAELEQRFWQLCEELVDPMVELAYGHTSPSVERSVLMRMGFSSMEAKTIVESAIDHELIGKGAGHLVYKLARERNMPIREAGLALAGGAHWDELKAFFNKGAADES